MDKAVQIPGQGSEITLTQMRVHCTACDLVRSPRAHWLYARNPRYFRFHRSISVYTYGRVRAVLFDSVRLARGAGTCTDQLSDA